ncbi:MAG: lipopolysaccharide biosynthesis protein [Bacteroidales bacterium]|nr:lipopolysaccharide biosynthesis protein [Bacteroidales bacterium]
MMEDVSNNKRIAKNTLALYARMLFAMFVGLYTSRVVLNTLGAVDFGIYNVVGGVVVLFSFLNSTLAATTQRFMAFEIGRSDDIQPVRKVFSVSMTIHIALGLLIVLLSETVGLWLLETKMTIPPERMNAARIVYQFSIISCFLSIIQVPYDSLLIARERLDVYALFSVGNVLLKLVFVILMTKIGSDKLVFYAFLMMLNGILLRIVSKLYCLSKFKESRYYFEKDFTIYKEIGSFAGWNLSAHAVLVARTQGVNILLNHYCGPILNTARGIGIQVNGTLTQLSGNFQSAVIPQITKLYSVGRVDEMNKLVVRSSKLSYMLIVLLVAPFIVDTEYILTLWLKNVPEYAVLITRFTLAVTLADSLSGTLAHAAYATGRMKKYQIIISSVLSMVFFGSWIALFMGAKPESVYIIEMGLLLVAVLAKLLLLRGMVCFPVTTYLREVVLKGIILSLCSISVAHVVQGLMDASFLRFCMVCFCSILMTSLVGYYVVLNKTERAFIVRWIKDKLPKFKKH